MLDFEFGFPEHVQQNANMMSIASFFTRQNHHSKADRKLLTANDNSMYRTKINEVLQSDTDQYQVLELLGFGSFGQVFKCKKKSTKTNVAIKILKRSSQRSHLIGIEISMLEHLRNEKAYEYNIIRTLEVFHQNKLTFIVFETMDRTLRQFLGERNHSPLSLINIRKITQQVLKALNKLKQIGITHADLKPENIMLVDHLRAPYRVKIIDFGNSKCFKNEEKPDFLQTRYYRSPEVLLGLPPSEAIDMWSLGCIVAELFIGEILYEGISEYDQIRFICFIQGPPTVFMLDVGTKTEQFFNRSEHIFPFWRLKTPSEYEAENNIKTRKFHYLRFRNLDDIGEMNIPGNLRASELIAEQAARKIFVDLLERMLQIDPIFRIDPSEALVHPYFNIILPCPHWAVNFKLNCCFNTDILTL